MGCILTTYNFGRMLIESGFYTDNFACFFTYFMDIKTSVWGLWVLMETLGIWTKWYR